MYKCLECGHIFEEGEQARWNDPRGEYAGVPCSETMYGCPLCKGNYKKTVSCEICESAHLENELYGGVCIECIDGYRKDAEMCFKVSEGEKEQIKINAFLASIFDENDIEHILYEIVKSEKGSLDCSKFIDEDLYWFGDRLAEEVKNDGKKSN